MAKQAPSHSIAQLTAMTLLTSIGVIPQEETLASDLSAQLAIQPIKAAENQPYDGESPSAEAVAEARWARLSEDFMLNEGGQIVPQNTAPEIIGAPTSSADDHITVDTHFYSISQQGKLECGPSPATPAEITRLVIEAAQRHDVDAEFAVAVVTAESRLDRLRNSPKGARGPMQLMPVTAERFGVTDICDPEENIDGGVRYLRALTDEFRNPLLVAAAYNAGEGRVREHGGIPPFKETLRYVAEVLNIRMDLEGSGATASEPRELADKQRSIPDRGVITSRERRQWVGGVMHF